MPSKLSHILPSLYNKVIWASTGNASFFFILWFYIVSNAWISFLTFFNITNKVVEKDKLWRISLIFVFLFWCYFSLLVKFKLLSKNCKSRKSSLIVVFFLSIILVSNNPLYFFIKFLVKYTRDSIYLFFLLEKQDCAISTISC